MPESELEKAYREMVLAELKELNTTQKEMAKSVGFLLDRMTKLETLVIGVSGKNGIQGRLETVEDFVKITSPKCHANESIMSGDTGILERLRKLENVSERMKTFRTQTITTIAVIQTIFGLLLALGSKLGWF